MLLQGSIDPLIQVSPQDNMKIQAQARQEAVTEAERKMVQCLEGNLSDGKGRFEDHKTMIRQFYEQMFDAKLMYLKVCD